MHRLITASVAAGTLALAGLLGASSASAAPAASASTEIESCTVNMPTGPVHVVAYFLSDGLTKSGEVKILAMKAPVLIRKDRVGFYRGAAGMASPGTVRSWHVPTVGFYNHASIRVVDSSGASGSCVTH